MRKSKEDQLESLKAKMNDKEKKESEREITLKYKKAKFFDRRRIMRTLKKLKNQISTNDPSDEAVIQFQTARENMMVIW